MNNNERMMLWFYLVFYEMYEMYENIDFCLH